MNERGPDLHDPTELRRRIVLFFSVGELRALADALGVGGIAWERGIQDAAREVVRQSERYAGLPALVARLREAKPEVDWDSGATPAPALPAENDGAPVPPAISSPPLAPPATAAFPALSASPGTFGPAPPLRDPYAPPPGPPAIQVPIPSAASAPPPPVGAWPGVTPVAPVAPARGIDPRILVAVAGLMVLAAVIAYLAGRASSAPAPGDAAAAASASVPPSVRSDGPAALAAGAIARSFANLARVCELPSSAGANALVFTRAFERCGPSAPSRRSPAPATPSSAADGSAEPAPTAEPAPPRSRRSGRGADQAPSEAPPAAKGCMGSCDAQHSGCRAHCGPEPTESSAYDGYQRCLGRCLSDASRCRLGCR